MFISIGGIANLEAYAQQGPSVLLYDHGVSGKHQQFSSLHSIKVRISIEVFRFNKTKPYWYYMAVNIHIISIIYQTS